MGLQEPASTLRLDVREDGIGVVVLDRPPVNAISRAVYAEIGRVSQEIAASDIRCVVWAAAPGSRAWCGGADLNDFVDMNVERRKERYAFINSQLKGLRDLDRPIVAAIDGPAVGVGMILAGLCDMRIASADATFACPEIDYGLVGGGAGLFAELGLPQAVIREMLFTGRRFSAAEMAAAGFLNRVVAREDVLDAALAIAGSIARKSLPSIKARKACDNAIAGLGWFEAYLVAQDHSAALAAGSDGREGVRAFLEGREARYGDS